MKNPNHSHAVMASAISAVVALGVLVTSSPATAGPLVYCKEQERCFGVSKAGKNDCATATSSCAGTARKDFQKDAWIYLPKGTCEKLAGGSLKPAVMKR
jgi:uncharacterized membrane protein